MIAQNGGFILKFDFKIVTLGFYKGLVDLFRLLKRFFPLKSVVESP
ncbi:hypothetical protein LEP1GSC171_3463 [Leptospira santarosai str. HAI1380]|nr:hypothetical protein LEP1GSC163_3978 [Leptospira santarosai str. CBC379]EMJ47085.1 hypothetical protein LEP1GSC169_3692 [Leptospira santarosai str. HAI1349]EMM86384.1 hypothetical protein LEP1GSC039_2077 [Leptospira santarosai str. 2000027870]EMO22281.1 hypothetical protein LEP1GSC168_2075 [Leptospira santarosai str. HAI134]EMP00864.1 hypothetical protein LEP1GSC171_3463 [Leptospira santarosai str. HAI1380]EMP81033.1 hypothetical protein LEP1GSC162_1181 [Leptospira santarosai str. CBC1531]